MYQIDKKYLTSDILSSKMILCPVMVKVIVAEGSEDEKVTCLSKDSWILDTISDTLVTSLPFIEVITSPTSMPASLAG